MVLLHSGDTSTTRHSLVALVVDILPWPDQCCSQPCLVHMCRYIEALDLHSMMADSRVWEPKEDLNGFLADVMSVFYGMVKVQEFLDIRGSSL